ncbi:MAG TPA: hypothetical protein VF605_02175 [Allosphingosinicella sp.]
MRIFRVAAVFCLAMTPWAQAQGCSAVEGYVRPSNFELVQISDAIVVATARAERRDRKQDESFIVFELGEKVKGEAPSRIELPGYLGRPRPSDQADIASSHPEGHQGPCNRTTFRKGGRYLLFLEKGEGGRLRQTGHLFSRINEDYAGEDTVWMRTVRRYLRLQATAAPMEQVALLERLAESGRGLAGERLKPAEIRDMRDHLSSLSPYKPTPYLLAAYAVLEQGKMPSHGVRSRAADREQSDADAIASLVMGEPRREEAPGDLAAMRLRVLTALVDGRHPDAMPVFERLAAETPEDPDRIGLALRFFAKNGAYGRAFRWIETRLMDRLAQLDPAAAGRLIGHVAEMQSGEGEGKEPWRSDARAAALWPELALDLYWYEVRALGAGNVYRFESALRTLPHDDYRARPPLTLALAAGYKEGIADWAVSELGDETKRKAWEGLPEDSRKAGDDPAALPLQILLGAWQTKHEAVLEQVFCRSGPRRLLLLGEIGEYASSNYQPLIERFAASALSIDERAALRTAMQRWQERMHRPGNLFGPSVAGLLKGEQSKGKPIVCRTPPG